MKTELIKKDPSSFKIPPNLKEYEKIFHSFSWNDAKKEIIFKNGKLNAAYNAIERNAKNWRKNKIVFEWIGEDNQKQKFTFRELDDLSNQFANLLHKLDIQQQDRVFFFLSRVPELYFGFLGTLKRGAIAGTMFAAFGPQAIIDRLKNSAAKVLITEPELFDRVEKAASFLPDLKTILVTGDAKFVLKKKIAGKKILPFNQILSTQSSDYQTRMMAPDDPAFMLYTSGTTGKPKGVVQDRKSVV